MNLLKSIFISSYMMFAMLVAGYAAWQIHGGADPVAWGGVLLATGPFLAVIGWIVISRSVARTSPSFPILNISATIGAVLATSMWVAGGAEAQAAILAVASWLCLLAYIFWFSKFARVPSRKIESGSRLPAFTVKGIDGKRVPSSRLTDRPAVLLFYRGNWCPLCMAQVRELARAYGELKALGVRVALISPQPHANTVDLAKRFDVDFEFLTDVGNVAARALGIDIKHGIPAGMQMMGYDSDSVMPTVIITDGGGKIVWVHETDNYRVRPEPEVFLEVLRRNGISAAAA